MAILRFGIFEVDSASGECQKGGRRLRLREQPLRLLLSLLDQAGHTVTREQLRHRLWPDATFVDFDRAINKAVSEVRGVLGDSGISSTFYRDAREAGLSIYWPQWRTSCPLRRSGHPNGSTQTPIWQ